MVHSIIIPPTGDNLTVSATSAGVVTVPSTTLYFSGAHAWLSRVGVNSVKVQILKILSSTTMSCRKLPDDGSNVNTLNYSGGGDLSAFTGTSTTASKDFSTVGAGHLDSVISAVTPGRAGNGLSIALVGDDPAGVTIVRVGYAFIIHYKTAVSTVGDVETAIGALAGADALIAVTTPGTGATVLTAPGDNFTATTLAGGNNSRIDQPGQTVRVNPSFSKRSVQ